MKHNQPLAGSWRSNPGNWRTRADAKQPYHRAGVARRSTIGISGMVELALVRGHRHTMAPEEDPMLNEPRTTARERRRQPRSR